MPELILLPLAAVAVFYRSRRETSIEILALRLQVEVLKRKRARPKLNSWGRHFWTALRGFAPDSVCTGPGDAGSEVAGRRSRREFWR